MKSTSLFGFAAAFAFTMTFVGLATTSHALEITGTTYQYGVGTNVAHCCTPSGNATTIGGGSNVDVIDVLDRVSSFGVGNLNNGLIGDQASIDNGTAVRADGFSGSAFAYQVEGTPLDFPQYGIYFSGPFSVTFDLGASYALDSVRIDWVGGGAGGIVNPTGVTISDGNSQVVYNTFTNVGNGATNRGAYSFDVIDLTGLSGQFITLAFDGAPTNLFNGLNEITFNAVPEPTSVSLLVMGSIGLAALRRRHRLAIGGGRK